MALLCFYTTYIVIQSPKGLDNVDPNHVEFSEICRSYLGRAGEIVAIVFSMFILTGAILAYYVLMSNFLYFTGTLIYVHCEMDKSLQPDKHLNSTQPPILFGLRFDQIWQLRVSEKE
ncbi:hypothetical protein ANCCEY_02656 [Ancylostoma ceylanicum]|uniref:Amino acid transporter transmembrane domain-containing protein n=1 Tax=Ancylostoma ceylanicum TaxID=53326 RepID=A0A0D6MC45_9BILA|nr:hypothetical protein ANCCEY_02656 [Ancylostoma ceylanicum]